MTYFSRKENTELKSHVQDQDDVILGLRKDLAGASARLSDITGGNYVVTYLTNSALKQGFPLSGMTTNN